MSDSLSPRYGHSTVTTHAGGYIVDLEILPGVFGRLRRFGLTRVCIPLTWGYHRACSDVS